MNDGVPYHPIGILMLWIWMIPNFCPISLHIVNHLCIYLLRHFRSNWPQNLTQTKTSHTQQPLATGFIISMWYRKYFLGFIFFCVLWKFHAKLFACLSAESCILVSVLWRAYYRFMSITMIDKACVVLFIMRCNKHFWIEFELKKWMKRGSKTITPNH